MTERWRGNDRLNCSRRWSWDTSKEPVVRHVAEQTIWGWKRNEFATAVEELLVPMLPLEVRSQLRDVVAREYTPYAIETHGFSFEGGYKASARAWYVSVRRNNQ